MRSQVASLSQEDFEIQKQAVLVKLAEKDINLRKEYARNWGEISTHKYDFDRQEKEIQVLQTIQLADFKQMFEEVFFSDKSKRVDLQLTSEAHKEE
jgi:insulysin